MRMSRHGSDRPRCARSALAGPFLGALVLAVSGCAGEDGDPSRRVDFALHEGVQQVGETTVEDHLLEHDPVARRLAFAQPAPDAVRSLAEGDAVLFRGLALGIVRELEDTPERYVVTLANPELPEVMPEADIWVDAPVDFAFDEVGGGAEALSATIGGVGMRREALRSALEFEGRIHGVDVNAVLQPSVDRLTLDIRLTVSQSGHSATLVLHGELERPHLRGEIVIAGARLRRMRYGLSDLRWRFSGRLEGSLPGGAEPVPLAQLPIMVRAPVAAGPIPLTLGIGVRLQVDFQLGTVATASGDLFDFEYDGNPGVQLCEGGDDCEMEMDEALEPMPIDEVVPGVGLSAELPRIELGVAGVASAWVAMKSKLRVGPSAPECYQLSGGVDVNAGVSAGVFGLRLLSEELTLVELRRQRYVGSGCE